MTRPAKPVQPSSGLLHELDDIRTLLTEPDGDAGQTDASDADDDLNAGLADAATAADDDRPAEAARVTGVAADDEPAPGDTDTGAADDADDPIPILEDVIARTLEPQAGSARHAPLPDAQTGPFSSAPPIPGTENLFGLGAAEPRFEWTAIFGNNPVSGGDTVTERLVGKGLDTAIRNRLEAVLDHWINDTLQVELALLRARLQDAVRTEIDAFIDREIRGTNADGSSHGE